MILCDCFLHFCANNCENCNLDISIGAFLFENDSHDNCDIWNDYWLL